MKILIVYYSRSGNTEKLAEALKKELETRGHFVDVEKIEPVKEHSFWGWWNLRTIKGECEIKPPVIKNVYPYDVICVGSPNWTRLSLPMARYLREVSGLKYKKIGFFSTSLLMPILEWYFFSAYLLDLTLTRIIEKKDGRFIGGMLLSSFFKNWDLNSSYGQKVLKNFCRKIETPVYSFKEYILDQRETEGNRLIIVSLLLFNIFLLIFQSFSSILGRQILSWNEIFVFLILGLFVYFPIIALTDRRKAVFLGKYIAAMALTISWTLVIWFLEPTLGRVIILGYVFCTIAISFFRDIRAVVFTGLFIFLNYAFLSLAYVLRGILVPSLDLSLLALNLGMTGFITNAMQKHFLNLLEIQDEIEIERSALNVKIKARTSELVELAQSLEAKVKKRTVELQEKIAESEKFNRLSIGRELKMIELKNEIKKLKEELKK